MSEAGVQLPSREDVRNWSAEERSAVARLLDECLQPLPTVPRSPRRRRLVLTLGAVGALVLLPWVTYLSATLPAHSPPGEWRTVWTGFDIALAAAFATTALTVWGRRQLAAFAMVVTATLLTCDAWFDVCLSWGSDEHWGSLLGAALELPVVLVLASSAATIMRRSCAVVAQLRGQDPAPIPLWRQPMIPAASARRQQGG